MHAHHRQAIDRVTHHFESDPLFPALIVGGSIAKGWERPDSDVDIILVATDEEYARRAGTNALTYFTWEFCEYEGGYIDGKIVDRAFLREVAERGSEPARSAFAGAWIAYSRVAELADLLARITQYPEAEHRRKLESFYAQMQALQWYVGEAEKRRDAYLMAHAVADLVLFGGRMILAHNRILYPYHKWFMTALRGAPDKPAALLAQIETLLAEPGKAHADAFCDTVYGFTDWPMPPEGWPARFMADSEWNWRNGTTPVADW